MIPSPAAVSGARPSRAAIQFVVAGFTWLVACEAPIEPAGGSAESPPSWLHEIAPLLERRCLGCHRPGGPTPFALTSYVDVVERASFIREVVREGVMPPWLPDDRGVPLRDPGGLTDGERAQLERWFEAGAPRDGDPDLDQPPVGVAHATPGEVETLVIPMPEPWVLAAEGIREMRTFALPLGNQEPLDVSGLTFRSNGGEAFHGLALLGDPSGMGRRADADSPAPGYEHMGEAGLMPSGSHGALGVGVSSLDLPAGYVFRIPPRSDLLLELHAQPLGRPLNLHGELELHLPVGGDEDGHELLPLSLAPNHPVIRPGQARIVFEDELVLDAGVELVGVFPRGGYLVEAIEVFVQPMAADGEAGAERVLLSLPRWDPHYRRPYLLEVPMVLEPGSRLSARWTADNSEDNDVNPYLPTRRVLPGDERDEEFQDVLFWVAAREASQRDRLRLQQSRIMLDRMRRR